MNLLDALSVLFRRWYIVAMGLILTCGSAFAVVNIVQTQYQASANLLFLLPSDATGAKTPTNPYLNLQPVLATTASIVSEVVTTADAQRDMSRSGFESDYSVAVSPSGGTPVLVMQSVDPDPRAAVRTLQELIRRIDDELERVQLAAKAPRSQTITTRAYSMTSQAEPLRGDKLKALAVVGLVGGVATLAVAFVTDGWLTRGRLRRLSDEFTAGAESLPDADRRRSLGPDARRS